MSLKAKILVPTALFALIAGMSMAANAAPSADVTLTGIITNTTCDVEVNNGQASLNVGVYKSGNFTVNTQQGSVPLPVTLTDCADETGSLLIQGITASANPSKQLFTATTGDTVGFMIKTSDSAAQVAADEDIALDVTTAGPNTYTFNVGMGSTTLAPAPGGYSTPITVAYVVN
ncbi:fimbrial protein [Yersinia intermedia]|uniref:fimbrial protein n=1 Tax=Yersinia intermedia TaxID=631 RepID=UPI0022FE579A|nr:fimbrial protein [Yersinia intermedia]MDA5494137.1 fimbrial protein [Yersinia intermedia]